MAGGQERVLKRRIKSVQSTKKITKAMQLIAASQIVRAQNRIAAARPYREGMAKVIREVVSADPGTAGRLVGTPERPEKVLVLAVVADRGMCGAYNSNVLRATERLIAEGKARGVEYRLVTAGKKAQSYFRYRGQEVERSFQGFSDRPTFADAGDVAEAISRPFTDGEVDQVLVVSTRFVSAGSQPLETRQLLPLTEIVTDEDVVAEKPSAGGYTELEPEAAELLATLAPRAVETEVYAALLEGAAAEVTARQRAMAAASDNADELIKTLSRIMNRARQDAITTEIMEIVGGAEALRASAPTDESTLIRASA